MARIRTIKPDFFLDDEIADLPHATRILFIGLWCLADKSGRLEDKPKKIKAQILPYENYDIEKGLNALFENEFIIRYSVNGKNLIQIRTFELHQRPHHTEKESTLPPHNGEDTVNTPLLEREKKVGKERKGEGKGKDRVFIPPSLTDVLSYFKEKGYREDVARKAFDFYAAADWIDSKGTKVRNWKQKMIGVWFKDENKIPFERIPKNPIDIRAELDRDE